jgi:hypothetical protein
VKLVITLEAWEVPQEKKLLFSIAIAPAPLPLGVVLPDGSAAQDEPAVNALANGQAGTPYAQQLQIAGGTPPDTLKVISGALPDGLTLTTDGQIVGVPTASGTFTFELDITDSGA